jgi:demethylmenaquinone methyltransferase/2-methoxy-6-polyprenyl-1,4-benzoquinol methylase
MTSARVPLRTALESPSSKSRYVRRLFGTIADRYDLITVLLSFGLDAGWKRRLASLASPLAGRRALDLACGTGDIAFELSRGGARVTGLDITHRMVEIGRSKIQNQPSPEPRAPNSEYRAPSFVTGDMMSLPFPDGHFDVVTTGYGLRNVPVLEGALAEIARVLRPGGQFLSLDFNHPSNALVRGVYFGYLTLVGSALGYALHRDADTYRYIPESLRRYPGAPEVVRRLRAAGFVTAEWQPVFGGLMAIHSARMP